MYQFMAQIFNELNQENGRSQIDTVCKLNFNVKLKTKSKGEE